MQPRATVDTLGDWMLGDAAAQGMDVPALDEHLALCKSTGADACLAVHRARIVQEWYGPKYAEPVYAMSTTKSIAGLLAGMLIADGRIRSADEPVCTYIPSWCTGVRGRVTLRHLLAMTSGLPLLRDSSVGFEADKNAFVSRMTPTSEPGARWAYSNEGAQLLAPILATAAGEPLEDYARRRLFEPLGMRKTKLHVGPHDQVWTYADMETTPRDLARIGVLMLHRGVWNGRRMLSDAWIDESTRPSQQLNPTYGLLWWLHPEVGGYAGHGHLDTHLHILPARDLVIVRMQAKPFPGVGEGTYEAKAVPLYAKLVAPRAGK